MKEVLFRGQELYTKIWYYGSHAILSDGSTLILEHGFREGFDYNGISDSDFHIVDSKTVGMFTGRFDSKGNRIFEHDYVVSDLFEGYVEYSIERTSFVVTYKDILENDFCVLLGDWAEELIVLKTLFE